MKLEHCNLIAAVGPNGELGLQGRLPWNDPEDLEWFKFITTGGVVLFGKATLASNPHLRNLAGRTVLADMTTSSPASNYEALIWSNAVGPGRPLWIAGGAKTYRRWLPFVRRSIITHVEYSGPADVYMPPLWQEEPE